jgi:hypothetical protein
MITMASRFGMIAMRPLDNIEAHIENVILLEINTNRIHVSCSYIVSASLQSLHKTNCVERYTAMQYHTYTVLQ